ncbi:probable manganese-transporting ATPase PDR2 [Magnolia sinica]|uniref:probable manganese-transporting ATPase PDR2 n=1 Tax=Magnolia sinica TaxID=86752 RepID=UPI0026594F75|nr:probable manganese-transporting ATPase PDR2 [Magnolia sinica]XP_058084362.1 probable manganese-transporting ATPase PDR2 [Magnolia sinica]
MSRFRVDGKVIEGVDLLKRRHGLWRLDVWPFAILYAVWLFTVVPTIDFSDASIVLGGLAAFHILVLLFTAWWVDFRCFVQYSKVKDIHHADACKITPAKFSGSKETVPLHFRRSSAGSSASSAVDAEEIYFDFRKQRFIFSEEKDTFCKLPYPSKETFGYYLKNTGHGSEAKVVAATEKWGRNAFEYPQPTFQKLMKEHCMEPFFVFQVFCVGLWCLDEYWYYSLFTLFMLFLFESTMAKSRLKTLTELRRVRVDGQTLMVHRCGKWVKLTGTDLLPGDVVSIGRSSGQNGEEKSVPADMLIIAGSAIVNEAILTGESTPQWKVSITGKGIEEKLSAKRDKSHILFGGTKILQHTPDKSIHLKTPDGGCLAVVLRTGFETSQGKLMRTILFSTERVTANSWESGLFILFLVVFAVIAAGYVLKKGLEDPTRSKYKLFLSCSLIITSVIPPELPMELSIAVNTSLIALARRGIFCTEPFRIPFAGKVDICCFDKTGTLTSDDMEFRGVGGLNNSLDLESDMTRVPVRTVEVLASCHALVFVDNKLVGDPLEKAALKGIDWIYTSDEKAMPKKGGGQAVQIVQRHHFASYLKRMAVVVRVQEEFFAFVKGAPETIQDRLIDLPPSYIETYKKYTRQGSRVLALAYKSLPEMAVSEARSLERDSVESGLTFAGFAVFNCPIRHDSASILSELKGSSHDLVMITGDQALTACYVASQVHIISKPALILSQWKSGKGFQWISPDETEITPYSEHEVGALSSSHDLCIGGDCFEMLQQTSAVLQVIPYIKVFARVAPEQKELIMTTFKTVGRMTLMCGDGTNDVGALKQAHVGVALLNAVPTPAQPGDSSSQTSKSELKSGKSKKPKPTAESAIVGGALGLNGDGPGKTRAVSKVDSSAPSTSNRHLTAAEKQRQKLKKLVDEMNEEGDGRAPPIVKLGDASMASPFTAKHASVAPTTDIIRQGRSTLVTTLQMFKILGLNCLATAYVLSVMYLDGVKLGDVQATISGIFTAAFFLFISHARPLPTLSAARPHPNIFCAYVLLSLLGQFAVHIFFLISAVNEAGKYMPEECIEPDSDFHPNLVNTVSYMVNMMIQVATFAVNYMGHPFNQSIPENKPFLYALLAAVGFFTVIASDLFRDLNDYLKLVPLPEAMRGKLLIWAFLMFAVCFVWERTLRWVFPGRIPAWQKKQRQAVSTLQKKGV